MAVLAAAAGLLDVPSFGFGALANGLAIRHLRLAHIGPHAELAHHAVHDDLQVQFAHARKNRLPGVGIGVTRNVGSSCASFWIAMPSFS